MVRLRCIRGSVFVAALLASLASVGCGSSSAAPPAETTQVFVGSVAGTDASVAFVLTGSDALFFACGGTMTLATLTHWFHGTTSLGQPWSFAETTSAATATGTVTATGASGMLSPGGGSAPVAWSAAPPAAGTLTGLYTEEIDGQGLADLIVEQAAPGAAPAAVGAFRTPLNIVLQVTPFDPIAMTPKGILASAVVNGVTEQLTLLPATATSD